MPSAKVQEMLDTLQNELHARVKDWEFDEQRVVNVYGLDNKLVVELGDCSEIHIVVNEPVMGDRRKCPKCGEMKSGWPDGWRNIAPGPGLQYACSDCAKKEGKLDDQGNGDS